MYVCGCARIKEGQQWQKTSPSFSGSLLKKVGVEESLVTFAGKVVDLSCHIWQLPASLRDTLAGKFWNDVQNLSDLDILFSNVQTAILAALVSTNFSKFGNLGVHKIC